MGLIITHMFQSGKLDGPDPTVVQPQRDWNAPHKIEGDGWLVPGMVIDFIGHTLPAYLLECYGQSISAATYPNLFAALVRQGTVTFTIATPGVVNWANHGLNINSRVRFRKNGVATFPTGITENVDYYIISAGFTTSAFQISATPGGSAIAFSGSQSGSFSGINAQHGVSNDLTTFSIPDLRGRVMAGLDIMGGVAANRLTGFGQVPGLTGGDQFHTLTVAELAVHQHLNDPPNPAVSLSGLTVTVNSGGAHTHPWSGSVNLSATGPAGGHAHAHTLDVGGTTDGGGTHSHTLSGVGYGASYGGAGSHAHGFEAGQYIEKFNATGNSGSHTILQPSAETGAFGTFPMDAAGAHEHSVYINDWSSGSVVAVAVGNHGHTLGNATVTGAITAVGDHTHTVSGVVTGTIDSAGAHIHTASASGTATSTQADYNTNNAGGGAAHNNVQPTFVCKKVVYTG